MTMSTRFEQLASDAMKLPVRERVRLAQQLVATIDDDIETATEKEIEEPWFDEAGRRLEELRSGTVQGVSGQVAFRNAREALKR